ncbi:restriction endonuclease subunit S [Bifidobacterium sp. ESL0745]|uniref:restriction endonuclease subunit S n=1 Tax=Bifidobacterium sp. ESL0745 TaxID=2983226 RepID=UPI0023F643B8|nr:restriction endonuclease subunit S [Bifidobacterium sp. ESL0745]MDF7665350.1 restriction endonuclease subunit S [Bifidobacterium sp. ESL0745]
MSTINEIIEKLCPDGVEYKALGDVGTFTRGTGIIKRDFVNEGSPCIHYGQIYTYFGMTTNYAISKISYEQFKRSQKAVMGDVIITITSENVEDVCTPLVWEGKEPVAVSAHACIFHSELNSYYVAYVLSSNSFWKQKKKIARGTKVIEVKPSDLATLQIPVPPLEIQQKIVEILEKFTRLELELESELELRKIQYNYYKNKLFVFVTNAEWLELGDLVNILDSRRKPITKGDRESGLIPYYGANGIQDYVRSFIFDGTFLLVGEDGSVLTETNKPVLNWARGQIWVNNHAHILTQKQNKPMLRYIMYALSLIDISELVHGTPPKLTQKNLRSIKIPVPSLDEQQRIVNILDKFNSLTSSSSDGMPAEIWARHQQYEYYRDKLLDFPRKKTEA